MFIPAILSYKIRKRVKGISYKCFFFYSDKSKTVGKCHVFTALYGIIMYAHQWYELFVNKSETQHKCS